MKEEIGFGTSQPRLAEAIGETADTGMVERVARAIWVARGEAHDHWPDDGVWEIQCDMIKHWVREEARGAIAAMQMPTAAMLAGAVMSAVAGDPDAKDYAITGAVLELLPPTGHPGARTVIAEISRDYRAAVAAALGKPA